MLLRDPDFVVAEGLGKLSTFELLAENILRAPPGRALEDMVGSEAHGRSLHHFASVHLKGDESPHGDTLLMEHVLEFKMAGERSLVHFDVGAGGQASSLEIDLLNGNGLGTFTR